MFKLDHILDEQNCSLLTFVIIFVCVKVTMESETKPTFSKSTGLPRKRFYRARAHSNPLSDSHFPIPISPTHVDFTLHFPKFIGADNKLSKKIEFADIGCGFGGLLISLATLFPETLMIGMELRDKVTEYVKELVLALRRTSLEGQYENISVVRTNSMKYIPNYFEKGQLSKMFFLFPDPHFKEKNHRRRVISNHLLDEYAYVLRAGGIIYTITDVEELGEWMSTFFLTWNFWDSIYRSIHEPIFIMNVQMKMVHSHNLYNKYKSCNVISQYD